MNPILSDILHIIAYTTIVLFSHKIILGIYKIFYVFIFAKPKNLKKLAGGDWAIITGSSDGLGKAYAKELAEKGFNLVLISRTESKLENVKNEIIKVYPEIQVKIIVFNFGNSLFKDYEKEIFPIIDQLDIGILVNNVGQMHKYPDFFHLFLGGPEKIFEVATVNTIPCSILTAKILPKMVERKSGIIINISSASCYHEMAKWSLYSGTKPTVLDELENHQGHAVLCLISNYGEAAPNLPNIAPTATFKILMEDCVLIDSVSNTMPQTTVSASLYLPDTPEEDSGAKIQYLRKLAMEKNCSLGSTIALSSLSEICKLSSGYNNGLLNLTSSKMAKAMLEDIKYYENITLSGEPCLRDLVGAFKPFNKVKLAKKNSIKKEDESTGEEEEEEEAVLEEQEKPDDDDDDCS